MKKIIMSKFQDFKTKKNKLYKINKNIFFVFIMVVMASCDNDSLSDPENLSLELPIEYINETNDNASRGSSNTNFKPPISFDFYNLDSDCDLSSINFDDFTTSVNLDWGGGYNPPYWPRFNNSEQYGSFPADDLTVALTGLFNDDDFLIMKRPTSIINPKTNSPYRVTRIESYQEYIFEDSSVGSWREFINGSAESSNQIRDLIACKLLEIAEDKDPTAFIVDIGVTALSSTACISCSEPIILTVEVSWGYHY